MASVVGIVNSAGRRVGAKTRVISLDDGTPMANLASDRYTEIRDELLRGHPWNFAAARAKLARDATAPVFGFSYAYQLPTGWQRTVGVFDNDAEAGWVDYKEEGGMILSDAEDIYLKFVTTVVDPNMMSADFRECIAIKLAIDAARSIVQSKSLADDLKDEFKSAIARARSTDSMGDRPDRMPTGSWVKHRQRSSSVFGG